jgi:hypothetical protein
MIKKTKIETRMGSNHPSKGKYLRLEGPVTDAAFGVFG